MIEHPWQELSKEDKTQYWATLALRHCHGLGPRSITRLLQHFGSAYDAINNLEEWHEIGFGSDKTSLIASGSWRTTAQDEWYAAQTCQAHILLWHHADYPPLLRNIIDAPALLYYRGDKKLLLGPCVAIVGSRNCSNEGVIVASEMARDLAKAGISIVSGLAQGIDRVAHAAALEGLGKSIAVLGTGIDVIYPMHNEDIYWDMCSKGLVITEYAPKTPPVATHFPVRNRIISGLCLGVLVIEGGMRSGTLITARQALEQNRDVFAVPGAVSSATSKGCQELIRQGAKAVFNADDILHDLATQLNDYASGAYFTKKTQLKPKKEKKSKKSKLIAKDIEQNENNCLDLTEFSSDDQKLIREILKLLYAKGACHCDVIVEHLQQPTSKINALLVEMELCAFIKRLPGSQFVAQSAIA